MYVYRETKNHVQKPRGCGLWDKILVYLVYNDGSVESSVGRDCPAGLLESVSHNLNSFLLILVYEGKSVQDWDTSSE